MCAGKVVTFMAAGDPFILGAVADIADSIKIAKHLKTEPIIISQFLAESLVIDALSVLPGILAKKNAESALPMSELNNLVATLDTMAVETLP